MRPRSHRRVIIVFAVTALLFTWIGAPTGVTVIPSLLTAGSAARATAPSTRIDALPAIGAHRAQQTACTTGCTLVQYQGGPVQHGQTVYLIFWMPPTTGLYLPPSYRTAVTTWLSDVATGNYTAKDVFSVAQQYYDLSGPGATPNFVSYDESFGGAIVDTDPYPTPGCTDADTTVTWSRCLTDAQIQTEITSVVTSRALPQNLNTSYLLLTPRGVGSCYTSASQPCGYSSYCGYHSFFAGPGGPIVYAELPWTYNTEGCDAEANFGLGYPNGSAGDPEVGVISQELIGMLTDPELNAWRDAGGEEIGDKCASIYGPGGYGTATGLSSNGIGHWNQQLNGDDYLLGLEFSNRDSDGLSSGCMASDTDTQPSVSITIQPAPVHGSPSTFTANVTDPAGVSSVQWSFGDGTTATTNPVNHTYSSAGSVTVSVIVTDNHGNEQLATQSVTVA